MPRSPAWKRNTVSRAGLHKSLLSWVIQRDPCSTLGPACATLTRQSVPLGTALRKRSQIGPLTVSQNSIMVLMVGFPRRIIHDLLSVLGKQGLDLGRCPVSPHSLARLLDAVATGNIPRETIQLRVRLPMLKHRLHRACGEVAAAPFRGARPPDASS